MWGKSTELLVPAQTAQKWKNPFSSHLDIKGQAREQKTLFPSIYNRRWMLHFSWHVWNNLSSGVVLWLWDVKAACSRKEIRFLTLMEESVCKSVAVLKVNNQILPSLMLQNTAKRFGGAYMERTGRVIANKRVLQFQFPTADVLSTSMTAKITSLFFFFFALSLLATAINVINSTSRKPPQRVGCEEIRCLLVLETIKFAISTELLQSLLPVKFRDSKNKKSHPSRKRSCLCSRELPPASRGDTPANGSTSGHCRQQERSNSSGSRGSESEDWVLCSLPKNTNWFQRKDCTVQRTLFSHSREKSPFSVLDAKEEGAPFWTAVIFYLLPALLNSVYQLLLSSEILGKFINSKYLTCKLVWNGKSKEQRPTEMFLTV